MTSWGKGTWFAPPGLLSVVAGVRRAGLGLDPCSILDTVMNNGNSFDVCGEAPFFIWLVPQQTLIRKSVHRGRYYYCPSLLYKSNCVYIGPRLANERRRRGGRVQSTFISSRLEIRILVVILSLFVLVVWTATQGSLSFSLRRCDGDNVTISADRRLRSTPPLGLLENKTPRIPSRASVRHA